MFDKPLQLSIPDSSFESGAENPICRNFQQATEAVLCRRSNVRS